VQSEPSNFDIALALQTILIEINCPAPLQGRIAKEFWERPEEWQVEDRDELATLAKEWIALEEHAPDGSEEACEQAMRWRAARQLRRQRALDKQNERARLALAQADREAGYTKPDRSVRHECKVFPPQSGKRVTIYWHQDGPCICKATEEKDFAEAQKLWSQYQKFVAGRILRTLKADHIEHIQFEEIELLVWDKVSKYVGRFTPRGKTDKKRALTTMSWLRSVTESVCIDWIKRKKETQAGGLYDITSYETDGMLRATKTANENQDTLDRTPIVFNAAGIPIHH
jgi:hypothetical protein